jgi:alpha-glucosidase
VFVRAGTILPRQPLVQSTATTPSGPLRLDIYPGADCMGTLYEDDGHSLAYTRQSYFRQTVRCKLTADRLSIDFAAPEGRFTPWWHSIAIIVHDWTGDSTATLMGKRLEVVPDRAAGTMSATVPTPIGGGTIIIDRRQAKIE